MPEYPVIAEFWSTFEGTLQIQAKRLVEDIAKHNNSDPKALWAIIKPQIKIGLLDIDLDDELPTSCSHPLGTTEGAIRLRCRAPCVLGFDACPRHIHTPLKKDGDSYELVDRVIDYEGHQYFVDKNHVAHDRNGRPKGYVEDGTLVLFEVAPKPKGLNADEET
jgi:hypothetical protein